MRSFVAALSRTPVEQDSDTDIEVVTVPEIVVLGIEMLRAEKYEPTFVIKIVYGVLAVARRRLGDEHLHVLQLEKQLEKIQPSRGIGADGELTTARLLAGGAIRTLNNLPEKMLREKPGPRTGPNAIVARRQYAVMLRLKVDHAGLTEQQATRLDFTKDLRHGADGHTYLILKPIAKGKAPVEEVLTDEAVNLIKRLRLLRRRWGRDSPLLFPPRGSCVMAPGNEAVTRYRSVAATTSGLYAEIKHLTGLELTFAMLKDLIARFWLKAGVPSFVVARRVGYSSVRTLELRHAAWFRANAPRVTNR